jgi:hypothetical protein
VVIRTSATSASGSMAFEVRAAAEAMKNRRTHRFLIAKP